MKIDPGMEPVALLALVLLIGGGMIGALILIRNAVKLYDLLEERRNQNREQDNG